uniref:Uncharacterized protein n=1 Tax=Sphaerodactylus townsendi TaxID=933632 RepID=A0ACB8FV06_9SAUR
MQPEETGRGAPAVPTRPGPFVRPRRRFSLPSVPGLQLLRSAPFPPRQGPSPGPGRSGGIWLGDPPLRPRPTTPRRRQAIGPPTRKLIGRRSRTGSGFAAGGGVGGEEPAGRSGGNAWRGRRMRSCKAEGERVARDLQEMVSFLTKEETFKRSISCSS